MKLYCQPTLFLYDLQARTRQVDGQDIFSGNGNLCQPVDRDLALVGNSTEVDASHFHSPLCLTRTLSSASPETHRPTKPMITKLMKPAHAGSPADEMKTHDATTRPIQRMMCAYRISWMLRFSVNLFLTHFLDVCPDLGVDSFLFPLVQDDAGHQ